MVFYPQDLDEKILSAINQIFRNELENAYAGLGDPLALRTLKQSDLQDDPTITAPYVIYRNSGGEDESICLIHGENAKIYGEAEIGGPIRYLYLYECSFGTPIAATRDRCRADAATLMNRIMATLIMHEDLSNVLSEGGLISDDQMKYIEGQNKRLVTKAGYRILGGEGTFYGRGKVFWQYPVSWNI